MQEDLPENPLPLPIPHKQTYTSPVKGIQLKSLHQARYERRNLTSRASHPDFSDINLVSPVKQPRLQPQSLSIIQKAKSKVKEETQKINKIPCRVINLVRTPRRSLK